MKRINISVVEGRSRDNSGQLCATRKVSFIGFHTRRNNSTIYPSTVCANMPRRSFVQQYAKSLRKSHDGVPVIVRGDIHSPEELYQLCRETVASPERTVYLVPRNAGTCNLFRELDQTKMCLLVSFEEKRQGNTMEIQGGIRYQGGWSNVFLVLVNVFFSHGEALMVNN